MCLSCSVLSTALCLLHYDWNCVSRTRQTRTITACLVARRVCPVYWVSLRHPPRPCPQSSHLSKYNSTSLAVILPQLCPLLFHLGSLLACLMSQQHADVSKGQLCSHSCTCCNSEIDVADPTFYLTQSQYTDTRPTSPSTDPMMPGAWQGSRFECQFLSQWFEGLAAWTWATQLLTLT